MFQYIIQPLYRLWSPSGPVSGYPLGSLRAVYGQPQGSLRQPDSRQPDSGQSPCSSLSSGSLKATSGQPLGSHYVTSNLAGLKFSIYFCLHLGRPKKPYCGYIPMTLSSIGWPQNIKQIKGGLCWPCVPREKEEGREQENTKMKGISLLMIEMSK